MKKLCKVLALTLCVAMLLPTLTVAGDSGMKPVLTLEEAKALALKNNTQFKLQDNYIKQSKEDYNEESDSFTEHVNSKYSSIAQKEAARIDKILSLDALYSKVEQEIFKKNDLKRESNYKVTVAYYDVMKSKYALDDAKRAMELEKKNLDIAKIKYQYGMITSTELSQAENTYKTSQTEYNKAVSDLQNDIATLSKNIGGNFDASQYEIDMTIHMPDIKSLDLEKIKADYIENSLDFFTLKQTLDKAQTKQYIMENEYGEYLERARSSRSEKVEEEFQDFITDATRDYDNVKYQYTEAEKALDISIKSQYTAIVSTADSIANLRKSVENAKTSFAQSKIMYELGQISKIEYETKESNLKDLENQLNTLIISLNAQYLELTQYSYTTEK